MQDTLSRLYHDITDDLVAVGFVSPSEEEGVFHLGNDDDNIMYQFRGTQVSENEYKWLGWL